MAEASAQTTALAEKLISAIQEKHGYSKSTKISVQTIKAASAPGFLTAKLTISEDGQTRLEEASISNNGTFFTEAPIVPLRLANDANIVEALKTTFGNDVSDVAVTQPSKWIHTGFRRGRAYSTYLTHPTRQDYYISDDGMTLVAGDLYYIYSQDEIRSIISNDARITVGPLQAKTTIAIFSDFQCPFCAELEQTLNLDRFIKTNPQIRLIFRNYPLPYHTWARTAALAVNCVFHLRPPAYMTYRTLIFKNQATFSAEKVKSQLTDLAVSLGIQSDSLTRCMADEAIAKEIDDDLRVVDQLQLDGTPSTFANGTALPTKWSITDLEQQARDDHNNSSTPVSCDQCKTKSSPRR